MLALWAALLAQGVVEAPRTVNGIEIGQPESFATAGPATVCMREMVVTPRAGETAYLSYSGIHFGAIRLVLANGKHVDYTLGEIFRDMRRPGQGTSLRANDMRVYLFDDARMVAKYQVHADPPDDENEKKWVPLVNVEGTALVGNRSDARFFERLSFDWDQEGRCDRRYAFGWDQILEGEPIDQTGAQ